jgi:hypothetical protein
MGFFFPTTREKNVDLVGFSMGEMEFLVDF